MAIALRSPSFWIITFVYIFSLVLAQDGDQFVYCNFKKEDLYVDGMATIKDGRLKVTDNTETATGHAFHKIPIKFKISPSSLFSFSTEFVFGIVPEQKRSFGQGMALVISPSMNLTSGAFTPYLGIFNRKNDNKTENHILAIELDTSPSPEAIETSHNHVGIDINSIISVESAEASYFDDKEGKNKTLLLASKTRLHIWIEYDGPQKWLNVTLAPFETAKPSRPLLSRHVDLSEIFEEQMFLSFSGSTGTTKSSQYILGWSFKKGGKAESLNNCDILDLPPQKSNYLVPILVSTSVVAFLTITGGIAYLYHKKKYAEVLEEWEKVYSPQRFSYRILYKATKGFKENQLLGAGGFGKVYRGDLHDGTQIAVKRVSHDAEQGMQQYVAEVASMGRLRQKNLVQLLGYCRRKGELLLVYEYMPNGSLDDYLFHGKNLSWPERFHIIKGVASALLYLHEEWEQVVLHRDIKASNILLDANLNGRLGDFGLARFHDRGMNLEATRVVGTIGYMAPELTAMGMTTTWTDVYAFGAFMLEVVCGRRPVDPDRPREQMILVKWVASCGRRGVLMDTIDTKLEGDFSTKEAELILKLGMLCSQNNPENRPSMRQIIQYLEGNVSVPDISFETTEFGIPNIRNRNHETVSTQTTTSSANFSYDTVSVIFDGR